MADQEETSSSVIIFEKALSSREPIKELLEMAKDFIRKGEMENLSDIDMMLIDRFIGYLRKGTIDDLKEFQDAVLSFTDSKVADRLKQDEEGERFFHRWDHFHDLCDAATENYDPELTRQFIESRKHGKELMHLLFQNQEGIRHNELSLRLGISPPHLSKLLREFQEHDLITRERKNKVSIIRLGITGRAFMKGNEQAAEIYENGRIDDDMQQYRLTPEPAAVVAERGEAYTAIPAKKRGRQKFVSKGIENKDTLSIIYNMKPSDKTVMQALYKNAKILKKFRVKKIGLFGSYSRGNQKQQSDIDLLVEFDLSGFDENFTGYYDNYIGLLATLTKILRQKVDLVTSDMISPHIRPYVLNEVRYFETA